MIPTKIKPCKFCQRTSHASWQCFNNPKRELAILKAKTKPRKPLIISRKPIRQVGKRTIEYNKWRDQTAKPYLDATFGRSCARCKGARCQNLNLDVNHKQNRGSRPDLKMVLSNVEYLGRVPCHQEETDRI